MDRTDEPDSAAPLLKCRWRRITLSLFFLLVCAATAQADSLSLEAGPGFHRSGHSEIAVLRYRLDAPLLLGLPGSYDLSFAAWNGRNRASAIGLSRSVRWFWSEAEFLGGSAGLGYLDRTTDNLGTRGQFMFRLALGRVMGAYELSLAYLHFSNGKLFFNWDGPNNGENFVTLAVALAF